MNYLKFNISEGGLGGHINHLYEDLSLTFRQLQNIIRYISSGKLKYTEKFDGVNIFLSMDVPNRKAVFARNKKDLGYYGSYSNEALDRFESDHPLREPLLEAMDKFEKLFVEADNYFMDRLFPQDKRVFFNVEIIDRRVSNVIDYDGSKLVIHRTGGIVLDSDGNKSDISADIYSNLSSFLDRFGDGNIIINPVKVLDANGSIQTAASIAIQKIGELLRDYGLDDFSTINDFVMDRQSEIDVSGLSQNQIRKAAIKPLESILHEFSVAVLDTVEGSGYLNVNKLKSGLNKSLSLAGDYSFASDIAKDNMQKISDTGNKLHSIEGIVFSVGGKVFKLTGNFAPLNQVYGIGKFKRGITESYLGNCITILDDDSGPWGDATEMQQFVDDGEEITKNEFIFAVGDIIDSFSDIEFPVEYYKNGNIYWIYDSMDIHWFFESEDYSDKSIKEAFTEASSEDIIVYHVTERRNRKSILEKGLIPKLGARSRQVEVGGKYVHVFLTTDALEDAFSSWIEDAFDEEKPLIVLELRVPKYWVKEDPAYPESVGLIDRIIPPNRIQMSKIQIEESAGIRESIEKITAIVSGSFKPPHKGHWQMVKYFSAKADKCVVIVSDPQKDESKRLTDAGEVITPEQVIDIFKIYAENDEVDNVIFKVAVSPVTEALRYIDEYAERGETILLGVSNKGDDEKRYKNIDKYSPDGVKVIVDVFDAITLDGEELSSSDFRDSIGSGDIDRFLPDLSPENKQRVKEIL